MSEEFVVQSQEITKQYGHTMALNGVNLSIKKGSIYGLIGNNGAGKTTFLKIIAGHIFPTKGTFTLLGKNTERGYREGRKHIGAIIENPGFFPKLTAKQNLEYYRIQRGIPGKKKVDEILREVGLEKVGNKHYDTLSLGMKQRLGMGLALMGEPELLILDEPINGLDPMGIIEVRNLLHKLNQEKGVTILISSHILSELENIATDYGFLNKGTLVEQLSAVELKDKCRTYLEIKVTDAPEYAALLETKLKCIDYKVMPGNCIHILNPTENINEYSTLAINHGIGLTGLEMREVNLEDYYMSLIGAENKMDSVQKEV